MSKILVTITIMSIFCFLGLSASFAGCEVCGGGAHKHVELNNGREITYEEFQDIRSSGTKYVLIDALSSESYAKGHIPGAISFPYNNINAKTASKLLKKTDKIVVYCAGFQCAASTKAMEKLKALGYKNVVDFKGGLQEWQEKGNKLVK